MGFPVGYTDLFIPPLFLHTLTFFTLFRNLLFTLFSTLGLPAFLDPNPNPSPSSTPPTFITLHPFGNDPARPPVSAVLTRELLTLVKLSDVEEREECCECSVCLSDVRKDDVIRLLDNCKHVFHKDCLDRWMDLDHHTCPLCRTPFLRDEKVTEFNRRLLSSRLRDFCSDLDDHHFEDDYFN
ncbi:brassinosteroid-responsive RING protein 1-like [Silene latifolia]|uniref:brassinosteroid-responsive RING protein 1-like n=1 Tax=Silene latifolia TaxID=37657 RepID=UPI003D77D2F4